MLVSMLAPVAVQAAGWQTLYNPDGTKWTANKMVDIKDKFFTGNQGEGTVECIAIVNEDKVWFDVETANAEMVTCNINGALVETMPGVTPYNKPSSNYASKGSVDKAVNTRTGDVVLFDGNYGIDNPVNWDEAMLSSILSLNLGGGKEEDVYIYPWTLTRTYQTGGSDNYYISISMGKIDDRNVRGEIGNNPRGKLITVGWLDSDTFSDYKFYGDFNDASFLHGYGVAELPLGASEMVSYWYTGSNGSELAPSIDYLIQTGYWAILK